MSDQCRDWKQIAGIGAVLVTTAFGAAIGCDAEGDSPPVTLGAAPQSPADEQPARAADEVDDESNGDEAGRNEAPAASDESLPQPESAPLDEQPEHTESHPAELPDGTDEQQDLLMEGRTAFVSGEYQRATEIFEHLAFDDPVTGDTVSAAIALAQIYIETGRPDEARALFDELEGHVAEHPEVLLVLARTYADIEEFDRAAETYHRAWEKNPRYIFLLPEKAQALLAAGDEDRASQVLLVYERRLVELKAYLDQPEESTPDQRRYVIDVFGLLDDERAHDAVEEALVDDPSAEVRRFAAQILGEAEVFDAEDTLRVAAVEDDAQEVRQTARRALETLREMRKHYEQLAD